MPNSRPPFSLQMSKSDFNGFYWYKEELAGICRSQGLSSSGTKAELEQRIRQLLDGEVAIEPRKEAARIRQKKKPQVITLETRLIPDGFSFNQTAREFFQQYYGVKKFSFTKEMASALRDAEKREDFDMTVADLIAVYESGQPSSAAEEKTYQWNRFVKAFHTDPLTKSYKNKLKIAAFLWKEVRSQQGSKEYHPSLLEHYQAQITQLDIAEH